MVQGVEDEYEAEKLKSHTSLRTMPSHNYAPESSGAWYARVVALFLFYWMPCFAYVLLFTDSGYGKGIEIHKKIKDKASTTMMMGALMMALVLVTFMFIFDASYWQGRSAHWKL